MSFCAMAEDMAARWMGDSGILCRSAEEDPRRKELKPVRVKVLGLTSVFEEWRWGLGVTGIESSKSAKKCHRVDRAWLPKAVRPNFALGGRSKRDRIRRMRGFGTRDSKVDCLVAITAWSRRSSDASLLVPWVVHRSPSNRHLLGARCP